MTAMLSSAFIFYNARAEDLQRERRIMEVQNKLIYQPPEICITAIGEDIIRTSPTFGNMFDNDADGQITDNDW